MSFFSDIYPLPNGIGRAPDNIGGIYGFFLRFPSNLELGLTDDNVNLDRTKALMLCQIVSIERGLHKMPLEGILSNSKLGEHIRSSYSLRADPMKRSSSIADLKKLDFWDDLEGQLMLADILRESVKKCKPLYIGLAEKQTIRDRISSHYEMRSVFGKKIKENNIGWDILGFSFISIDPKYYNKKNIRSFEKMLQRLTNPIFSEL